MKLTLTKAKEIVSAALGKMPPYYLRRSARFAHDYPQRVLFDGHFSDGDCYCPMLAGLSRQGIKRVLAGDDVDAFQEEFGLDFDPCPERFCLALPHLNVSDVRTILHKLIAETSA